MAGRSTDPSHVGLAQFGIIGTVLVNEVAGSTQSTVHNEKLSILAVVNLSEAGYKRRVQAGLLCIGLPFHWFHPCCGVG